MVLILFASCCIITPKIGLKVQATIGFHRNLPPYYGHSVISLDCVNGWLNILEPKALETLAVMLCP